MILLISSAQKSSWSTLTLLHPRLCELEIRAMSIWVSQWIFSPKSFVIMLSGCRNCVANLCCGCTGPSLGDRKSERHCMPMLLCSPETVLPLLINVTFHFIESYSLFLFYLYVFFLKFFLTVLHSLGLCLPVFQFFSLWAIYTYILSEVVLLGTHSCQSFPWANQDRIPDNVSTIDLKVFEAGPHPTF